MAVASKTTTIKKASTGTEIVLGQAAQQITKAVLELNNSVKTVNEMALKSEELTLLVANKEQQIAELAIEFEEKKRQLNVELDLSFKADTDTVVNSYLRSTGKEAISATELQSLRNELSETKANADAQTKKELAVVVNTLKSQYENEIKLIHSENKAIFAENASKIGVLAEKNKFLDEQVGKLYLQLDAERNAGIERAKAGSIGSINVGDGSRK